MSNKNKNIWVISIYQINDLVLICTIVQCFFLSILEIHINHIFIILILKRFPSITYIQLCNLNLFKYTLFSYFIPSKSKSFYILYLHHLIIGFINIFNIFYYKNNHFYFYFTHYFYILNLSLFTLL